MSTAADQDQYYPGLEGVIANESAIANLEGKEGSGGLEYRGYRIEDLATVVSYEETAFLLLHGDLPTRGQLAEFDARLRAVAEPARTPGGALRPDPRRGPPDGRAPDLGERPGALRPRGQRAPTRTTRPTSARPSG